MFLGLFLDLWGIKDTWRCVAAFWWGYICVIIDYNTMHVDAVLNYGAAIQPPILAPSHGGQKGAEGSIGG
jgi:hypothetical protein